MSKLVNQQSFYVVNLATCDALVAALVMPLKALEYMASDTYHQSIYIPGRSPPEN